MDGQLTLERLANATQPANVRGEIDDIFEKIKNRVMVFVDQFIGADIDPQTTFQFEAQLAAEVRELGVSSNNGHSMRSNRNRPIKCLEQ